MKSGSKAEFCLIVEGAYYTEQEAEHALRDPFVEEFVEETGKFRVHNFDDIEVASGFSLGSLAIKMIEEEVFEISSNLPNRPLTEEKAQKIAEALRRHDMFDEISIEPVSA